MKKLIAIFWLVSILIFPCLAFPDSKITGLTEDTAPTGDDLIETANDPGGTPVSRKSTIQNLTRQFYGPTNINNQDLYDAFQDFNSADQTPRVDDGTHFRTWNLVATVIQDFDDGGDSSTLQNGKRIVVSFRDNIARGTASNTTIEFSNSNLSGNGELDWSPKSGELMECFYHSGDGVWDCMITSPATSANSFLSLSDTPGSYSTWANALVVVNNTPNALVFSKTLDVDKIKSSVPWADSTTDTKQHKWDLTNIPASTTYTTVVGRGFGLPVLSLTSTQTLTADDMLGTRLDNYGASGAIVITLPAAAANYNFIFSIGAAQNVELNPNGSEIIYLNGTALTGGYSVQNTAPTIGEMITFIGQQTGASTYGWIAKSSDSDWVDKGS